MGTKASTKYITDPSKQPCYVNALKLVAFIGGAVTLTWIFAAADTRPNAAQRHSRPFLEQKAASSGSTDITLQPTAASVWEWQAAANLSEYKGSVLSHVGPYEKEHDLWSNPIFQPIVTCPDDRPLTRYGGTDEEDGSKLLCRLSKALQEEGCVIYSLGSKGDYSFEQSMLSATRCKIHTFDCTISNGASQEPGRHFFHKWCLGEPHVAGEREYYSWKNITNMLGHKRVNLLKMDIEGFEFQVIPTWRQDSILPDELSMEVHARRRALRPHLPGTPAELGLTFIHLANLGYAMYSQEVNALTASRCCAEVTMMRLGQQAEV